MANCICIKQKRKNNDCINLMPIKIPSNVESNTKKLISTSLLYNKQKNISNKRGKGTKFYKKNSLEERF